MKGPPAQSDHFRDSDQDTLLGKNLHVKKILRGSPEAEFF